MPLWYTNPNTITSPLQIDGLIGWYTSNSAQFGPNNFLIRWQDLSSCKNDIIPYYSNIKSDFLFNNAVLKNESLLNLDTISSGATVFIVADLSNNEFDQSNYVSFFTNDFNAMSETENLITSVGKVSFDTNNTIYTAAGYINNSNVTQSISPGSITTNMSNFNIFIGDYSNERSGHGINNKIFEVLLYNKVLPISEINFINNYLVTKHNITNLYNNNFMY